VRPFVGARSGGLLQVCRRTHFHNPRHGPFKIFGVVAGLAQLAGLDRGRFHWSDGVPAWLRAAGLIALAAGYGLALWAMLVNRFFSSVVRIQSDRGQYVVTSGPYRWIRHPGYLAGIMVIVASGIALGSWLATALLIVLSLPFLLYRAITEDRVLQAELPGYRDYAARVRWRVLPGIW